MLPKFLQLWEQKYSEGFTNGTGLISAFSTVTEPSSIASLFALYQRECNRAKHNSYYSINIKGHHVVDIIKYTKEQHLKNFLKYTDKFGILLFNPEEFFEFNKDVTTLPDEQLIATGLSVRDVHEIKYFAANTDFSGVVTPESNCTDASKKINMCFRSQIFS